MATTIDRRAGTSASTTARGPDAGIVARFANIVVGAWLFISAFIWPHSAPARMNTWIVGALCAIFAVAALRSPPVRWLNTVLAIWLFFSVFSIYHLSGGTFWNNLIAAIVMFIASLVPSHAMTGAGRPPRYVTP
jgi:hypothetical protein